MQTGVSIGASGDVPVQADYDGDGKTDMALWRPLDGGWRIRYSTTGAMQTTTMGQLGDEAVVSRAAASTHR
jgi:hypothetical protein